MWILTLILFSYLYNIRIAVWLLYLGRNKASRTPGGGDLFVAPQWWGGHTARLVDRLLCNGIDELPLNQGPQEFTKAENRGNFQ